MRLRIGEALLLYLGVVLLLIGGAGYLQLKLGPLKGIAVAQWAFIALPVLLTAQARTGTPTLALGVRLPRPSAALGAVLIGVSLSLVLGWLVLPIQEHFFPTPKDVDHDLQTLVSGALWPTLAVVAVTPAVCEELLCRGAIARAFTSWNRVGAVLLSAALFSILHLEPHRLLPTFLLGIALAIVALRSGSTLASMIVHALNNATIIVTSGQDEFLNAHATAVGVGALAASIVGFLLILRSKVTPTTLL